MVRVPELSPACIHPEQEQIMGKGDVRTRRGKQYRGTHGKTRPAGNKKRDHAAEARSVR
jgi:ribosomal small subunit protein bTHX